MENTKAELREANRLKYESEIFGDFNLQSDSITKLRKDDPFMSVLEQFKRRNSIDVPYLFNIEDFEDNLNQSDFPSLNFFINAISYTELEIITKLKSEFESWKFKLLSLPKNQNDINMLIDKLDEIIQTLISPFYRSGLISSRSNLEDYPSNAIAQKLFRASDTLKILINSEKDKDKKRVYTNYLLKIRTMIDPDNQEESKQKITKEALTFSELFKPEYVVKIDRFYSRLIASGYIDKNHIWRETENKNEPAKVYFWLLEYGVLKYNKPTPALICFCNEFGITAYKDNEPTPSTDIRAVTVKNLLIATINRDEKKHFENVFSSFLIK